MVRKYLLKIIILLLLFRWISSSPLMQVKDDLNFLIKVDSIKSNKKLDSSKFIFKEITETKLLATGVIRLYQLFISSQDMPVCNFKQTCSRFGMEAIQKYGIFFGILMTADRLMRCNGVGNKYYPMDIETGRAIDYSVETYYLGKKNKKTRNER